jgi:uncharacterized protein YjiS (DUF1127 family)
MTMTTISNDTWREKPPIRRGDAAIVRARLRWPLLGGLRGAKRVAIAGWRARRATQLLDVLDDRMLRDIGMVRSEIEYGVRRHKTAEW